MCSFRSVMLRLATTGRIQGTNAVRQRSSLLLSDRSNGGAPAQASLANEFPLSCPCPPRPLSASNSSFMMPFRLYDKSVMPQKGRLPSLATTREFKDYSSIRRFYRRPYAYDNDDDFPRKSSRGGFLSNLVNRIDADNWLYILIGINAAIFLLWQLMDQAKWGRKVMYENFTISLHNLKEGRVWTLLTSTFSHQRLGHLIFNMISLYFIGRNILHVIGASRFLGVYLAGGLASTVAAAGLDYYAASQTTSRSVRRAHEMSATQGASGSVMAVMVLFGAFFPRQIIYLNFIIPVPAIVLVAGYIALDLYGVAEGQRRGVSNIGHLGGAVVGLSYFLYNLRRGRIVRSW